MVTSPAEKGRGRHAARLVDRLRPALRALEKDLLGRSKVKGVEGGLRGAWEAERRAGHTGAGFEVWRRERVTQLAAAWVFSLVFVRTLEDRGYIDPRVAGPNAEGLRAAEDREALFLQVAPFLGPREYLLSVFRELAKLPGARDVFDSKLNPVWRLSPSSEGAQALLDFFRKRDEEGAPAITFTRSAEGAGEDTRFLGDLYQDLSETARKRYALLQTPDFVEAFILEQTLDPAIDEFGLAEVRLIDPTCGSGHFLLGAFRRLLERWRREAPMEPVEELARRALAQVAGVDINPFAVAIARFRLVLAVLDAVGIDRLERAPEIHPEVVVADSLLHRFGPAAGAQMRLMEQAELEEDPEWGDNLFRLEDSRAVEQVLSRRYHAVVGNPPYITEKDRVKRDKYRELYESAAGKYALAAPFTERFFDLGVEGGFVGMINSNAWTKRDYGKVLVEKVLPRFDVQKIIDTSGCYLPGHGTPTLLLFGQKQKAGGQVLAVLGKRGEQREPKDPATAPVWSEIVRNSTRAGFEGEYVSVEVTPSREVAKHPWILLGGGGREVFGKLEAACVTKADAITDGIGFCAFSGQDPAFLVHEGVGARVGLEADVIRRLVKGEDARDWDVMRDLDCIAPYSLGDEALLFELPKGAERFLWPSRTTLQSTKGFGGRSRGETGARWWEWSRWVPSRHGRSNAIVGAYVSTHNHFVRASKGHVYRGGASVNYIDLRGDLDESMIGALLGYLNSSTVAFWCRLVMFPKGGDQVGDGARLSATQWNRHLEYAGNLLKQLPVPKLDDLRAKLLDLVVAAEETVAQMEEQAAEKVVAATLSTTPSLTALREARAQSLAERSRLRGILVSLQEEMDWRVYGIFGLPTVESPSLEAVRLPVAPNHRPFEVRLAREVETDISASEWFRVHKREAPEDVGGPLADLYRERLRLLDDPEQGKQLRLLETPETKRRWQPQDDTKAFSDAMRTWVLDRIEDYFREQGTPELRSARQLALELGRDPAVAAAHELLTEESGHDMVKLFSDLVDAEEVPFLAGYRYSETGMEKRASWEETWRLQRLEDEDPEKLAAELRRLELSAIPVPDNYAPKDFLRHHWGLRGKLDVPKERFVSVPGGNADEDTTPLIGWAGWDHLQVAQALSSLYQRRKTDDGWPLDRLLPLLAGIAERVPWLLQWHNEASEAYGGVKLGDFFRDFVAEEARSLGVAVDFSQATDALRTWTPPAAPKRSSVDPAELLAALIAWSQEGEDDDEEDEEAEPPEGATEAELATALGAQKNLVKKALKQLLADDLIEKRPGRPIRYVAVGAEP